MLWKTAFFKTTFSGRDTAIRFVAGLGESLTFFSNSKFGVPRKVALFLEIKLMSGSNAIELTSNGMFWLKTCPLKVLFKTKSSTWPPVPKTRKGTGISKKLTDGCDCVWFNVICTSPGVELTIVTEYVG